METRPLNQLQSYTKLNAKFLENEVIRPAKFRCHNETATWMEVYRWRTCLYVFFCKGGGLNQHGLTSTFNTLFFVGMPIDL